VFSKWRTTRRLFVRVGNSEPSARTKIYCLIELQLLATWRKTHCYWFVLSCSYYYLKINNIIICYQKHDQPGSQMSSITRSGLKAN